MADISTAVSMARVPILGENGRISDDYIPASIPQAVTAAEQAAESAASSANQALQQAAAAEKSASSATGSVEQAKTYANNASTYMTTAGSHAESAAADANAASTSASAAAASAAAAEESNKSAAQSSADAMGFRNNAVQYRDQAREAAQEAEGYVSTVQQLSQNATNSAAAAQNSATSASASAETATTAASQASASATNAAASAQTASEKAASVLDHYIESATATTLEAGQPATATVVDKVLQLGIPKGDKGDPGEVSAVQVAEGSDLSVSTDEGTVTIDDSALRARIEELENASRNVLTGTSTGLVAHADDAYAQKPIETRIKGKTWVNRWPVIEGTHNGITVSTDGTGLVTVTGTATADADVTADVSGWATGKSYTTMISATPTGCSAYFEVQKPSGNTSINATTTGATLNVASDATNCVAGVHVTSGTTVNASFRVMLVEGTEAPDCFTPCASITSVETGKLVTSGKNLLSDEILQEIVSASGSRNLTYEDGVMTVLKNDGQAWSELPTVMTVPPGTYVASFAGDNATVEVGNGNSLIVRSSGSGQKAVFTVDRVSDLSFKFLSTDAVTFPVTITDIQLELGSTATSYEPPTVTQTPIPEVELRSLPNGTCDELVIRADGTCEVERVFKRFDSESSGWYGYNVSGELAFICIYAGSDLSTTGWYDVISELPVVKTFVGQDTLIAPHWAYNGNAVFFRFPATEASDLNSAIEYMASIGAYCYAQARMSTEPQSPVTLPALPAPTFNAYHDSPVPSDTSTEYVRDINIVIDNLAKQVAGTAATVAINEATR